MTWFAAHALITIQRTDLVGPIHVYENVFLVEANDSEGARAKAIDFAKLEVEVDDELTVDGMPTVRKLAGIRKVISVSNPDPLDLDNDRPISGTEITYSEYEVFSEDALQRLIAGDAVTVRYVD